jgi:hypothetical protein
MAKTDEVQRTTASSAWRKALSAVAATAVWVVLAAMTVWAIAALYIDVRTPALRAPLAVLYGAGSIIAIWKLRPRYAACVLALAFAAVVTWWFSLEPTNNGPWKPNNERTAWAEVSRDTVIVHNVRNCEYRAENDYSDCWHDRVVHLSKLSAADFTLTTWGSKYIGHPIVSFDFGEDGHLAFSLEVRYRPGQDYSAILGLFRQSPVIFIAADERDVLRLRTNYRTGEEVYLYRTTIPTDVVKAIFSTYIGYLNRLHEHPEWYNALTKNCTTALNRQIDADLPDPRPWNYQLLLNGTIDQLLYSRGRFVTGGLPFSALKAQAHINEAAKAADADPEFSARIRAGRVGF